jgi:hypothetical protein
LSKIGVTNDGQSGKILRRFLRERAKEEVGVKKAKL